MSLASWLGFAPSSTSGQSGQQRRAAEVRRNDRAGHAAVNTRRQDRSITAWFRTPPTRSS